MKLKFISLLALFIPLYLPATDYKLVWEDNFEGNTINEASCSCARWTAFPNARSEFLEPSIGTRIFFIWLKSLGMLPCEHMNWFDDFHGW